MTKPHYGITKRRNPGIKVPSDLQAAIKPLRKSFDRDHFLISLPIQHLCYAQLHGELGAQHQEEIDTFQQLKLYVPAAVTKHFANQVIQGTPPAIFKAYFDFYVESMAHRAGQIFEHLREIGVANESRLGAEGIQWAQAQTKHLIRSHRHCIQLWVRQVCDKDDFDFRAGVDAFWESWRAPAFLVMKPARYGPYEPQRVWERQDSETSLRWLVAFADDYVIRLEMKIEELAAEALLVRAKHPTLPDTKAPAIQRINPAIQSTDTAPPSSNAHPRSSAKGNHFQANDSIWKQFATDFSKLASEEKSANAQRLCVLDISESEDASDSLAWAMREGHSENFRARFKLLASQAGKALGQAPIGVSFFDFWLQRLHQHLAESNSNFTRREHLIDDVCEASSTFCFRLANLALEEDQAMPPRDGHLSTPQIEKRQEAQSLSRRERVDEFLNRVLSERGIRVPRNAIHRAAGYKSRRDFEKWEKGESSCGSAPDMAFNAILALSPDEFLQKLESRKPSVKRGSFPAK